MVLKYWDHLGVSINLIHIEINLNIQKKVFMKLLILALLGAVLHRLLLKHDVCLLNKNLKLAIA